MALAIATALAAGVAPAALGGAAAVAAPSPVVATAETGTVVQEGGPLVVPSGEEVVTTRVTVTLPEGASGTVKARLILPITWDLVNSDDYPLGWDIMSSCSVNGGPFQPCPWDGWRDTGQQPYVATMPATEAAPTITYDIRIESTRNARRWKDVNGTLEVGAGGAPDLASGPVTFQFARNTPSAGLRTTVLARDNAGVLWQYESTGLPDKPLKARERIGGGWNVYTSITGLGERTAAGEGDLVARDKAGVLWFYEGSGNPDAPFKPRVRVGGGWNAYTALTTRGDGLLARDRDGVLWYYRRTQSGGPSAPFGYRQEMADGGWNAYSLILGQGLVRSVVARDKAGVLWSFDDTGSNWLDFYPRWRVGGGWNTYDRVAVARDLSGTVLGDYLARDKEGDLWLYEGVGRGGGAVPTPGRRQIGWGWGIYDTIL
ncbi:hypothetical protein ACFXGT_03555 [Streptomyces sp. NPDC059352]|uniref:hypothetical protein n=1 Tax=Streptomyces sp. NPDC059352 TaxID=3346810 RepID=UPI0036881A28